MAGILNSVFTKGIVTLQDPENVSKLKTVVNHSALYLGLLVYTAAGAKVFQLLELPAELARLQQAQLNIDTSRAQFLRQQHNNKHENKTWC